MEGINQERLPPGDCTGGNISFMQLLAGVGGISPQNITRSQDPPSQSRNVLDSIESPAVRRKPMKPHIMEQCTFRRQTKGTMRQQTDGEDDLSRVLPCEDGELFDYEYNISDEDLEDEEDLPEQEDTVDLVDPEEHEVSMTPGDTADEVQTPWKKRKRHVKGVALPNCRKSIGLGAVEIAMRKSGTRSTTHIFEPSLGLTFDSVAEARNFYDLYSWEVGFGIRLGRCHKNGGNKYRTMQGIECCNEGSDGRVLHQLKRCECKAMIKLHRTEDHGWYISRLETEHNHPLATSCGEKMQWCSHNHIDQAQAMEKALLKSMPNTVHLWCKWHVLKSAPESLGLLWSKNARFREQFYKVINEMLTIDEFEQAWTELVERYNPAKSPLPFIFNPFELLLWYAGCCKNVFSINFQWL